MAHGTPLATGEADDECGAAGPFLLEVGISSSYHIAKFFGLTDASSPPCRGEHERDRDERSDTATRQHDLPRRSAQPHVLEGEVLEKDDAGPEQTHDPPDPAH